MSLDSIVAWFTVAHLTELSVVASALANLIPPNTIAGRILHALALNLVNAFGKKAP